MMTKEQFGRVYNQACVHFTGRNPDPAVIDKEYAGFLDAAGKYIRTGTEVPVFTGRINEDGTLQINIVPNYGEQISADRPYWHPNGDFDARPVPLAL